MPWTIPPRHVTATMSRSMKHAILCLLLVLVFNYAQTNADQRPNVVFIVVDNVAFEHMGERYGGESYTPVMDRIVAKGVKFTRAYATTPLFVPSRYTCLSERHRFSHGETERHRLRRRGAQHGGRGARRDPIHRPKQEASLLPLPFHPFAAPAFPSREQHARRRAALREISTRAPCRTMNKPGYLSG